MRRALVLVALVATVALAPPGPAGAGSADDTTPPTIRVLYPREGARIPLLSRPNAGFDCQDDRAVIVRCEGSGYETDVLGPTSMTLEAEDAAGNTTTLTVHLQIVDARCNDRPVTVYLDLGERPTAGDDVVLGRSSSSSYIDAGLGDDAVCVPFPENVVRGGPGDDSLTGNGVLRGGRGNDLLRSHANHDQLYGGPGRDILAGHEGVDRLSGGPGADWLDGGPQSDLCVRPVAVDVLTSCERR